MTGDDMLHSEYECVKESSMFGAGATTHRRVVGVFTTGECTAMAGLLYGGIFEQGQGEAISENYVQESDRQAFPDLPRYMEKIVMNNKRSDGWMSQPTDLLPAPYTGCDAPRSRL